MLLRQRLMGYMPKPGAPGRSTRLSRIATALLLMAVAPTVAPSPVIKHPRQENLQINIDQPMDGLSSVRIADSHRAGIQCNPCANDGLFDTAFASINENRDSTLCTTAAKSLPISSEECQMQQLANYQHECCPEPPRGVCTLCPNGSTFDALTVVPSLSGSGSNSRTCADLLVGDVYVVDPDNDVNAYHYPFLDYLFTPGDCSDTLLQRSAAWCQCEGVEQECSLCPSGRRPNSFGSGEHREKIFYGWDCDTFEYVASWFSEQECSNMITDILEFDAPAFCQCTDSGPPPDICSLCAGEHSNGLVNNPEEALEDGAYTCHDLATSLRFIPNESTCDRLLESYRANGVHSKCCDPSPPSEADSAQGMASNDTLLRPGMFTNTRAWTVAALAASFVLLFYAIWYSCKKRRRTHQLVGKDIPMR